MARIVQLLEIELKGSSFRVEIGGHVALAQRDEQIAVVRVHTLAEAKRLETLANEIHPITFRWKQGQYGAASITVTDFEKQIAADPSHYLPDAAIERLGFRPKAAVQASKPTCDNCGHELFGGFPCGVCGPVDNNIPGKHD